MCKVDDSECGSNAGDSLSATLALLVGDSLAAEGSKLVLHGVGDQDTNGDQDEEDDQDDGDGNVAFHHFERWGPTRASGRCV